MNRFARVAAVVLRPKSRALTSTVFKFTPIVSRKSFTLNVRSFGSGGDHGHEGSTENEV
jgi:hypothetical protein